MFCGIAGGLDGVYGFLSKSALALGEIDPLSFRFFESLATSTITILSIWMLSCISQKYKTKISIFKKVVNKYERINLENIKKSKESFIKVYLGNLTIVQTFVYLAMVSRYASLSYIYKGYLSLVYTMINAINLTLLFGLYPLLFPEEEMKEERLLEKLKKWTRNRKLCVLAMFVTVLGTFLILL